MSIKRYTYYDTHFYEDKDGDYIKYEDHLKALQENQPGYYESIIAVKIRDLDDRLDKQWRYIKQLNDKIAELKCTQKECVCTPFEYYSPT